MNGRLVYMEKVKDIFQNWLSPLVNVESTLLLFGTFIFHQNYFGSNHVTTEFLELTGGYQIAIYLYSLPVFLVSLLRISDDWQEFAAFIIFIGNVLISVAYASFFWISASTPTWAELLAECYYVLQSLLSLILIILLLTQERGKHLSVTPRLGNLPSPLKTLMTLTYILGMTWLLDRGFSVAPDLTTAQVNLIGALLLNTKFTTTRRNLTSPE